MSYKHLNIDERESILKMLSEEKNITHIAELLGRNKILINCTVTYFEMSRGY